MLEIVDFGANYNRQMLKSAAKLYCQIWQEPPWNEDFWTVDGVIKDLDDQIQRPGAKGLFAINDQKVVGFTWGYLADKEKMREISGGDALDFIFTMCSNVFYLAELGVCKLFRNQKLGNKLTSRLIDKLIQEGTNTIVLRTDLKAQAARRLYQKLGFVDLKVLDSKHANRTYWIIT